jgi:CBS domain-containing protein
VRKPCAVTASELQNPVARYSLAGHEACGSFALVESPRAPRLVVLQPTSTVYEAARAMEDNRVGTVLVVRHGRLAGIVTDRDVALAVAREHFAAASTPLSAVMTDVVGACEEDASVADIVTTMRQYACRRVPLVRAGRPVGIVTLDDLIVQGVASLDDIAAIVGAQLEQPARLKPSGSLRPSSIGPAPKGGEHEGDGRESTRAESIHSALVREVERVAGVGSPARAEAALGVVLERLHRRMPAEQAKRLAGLLPARVRDELTAPPLSAEEAEHAISLDTIACELLSRFGILPDATLDILLAVCEAMRARGAEEDLCARMRGVVGEMASGSP